jgi:hypothetical protein
MIPTPMFLEQRILKVLGTEGEVLELASHGMDEFGICLVTFRFELTWATGTLKVECTEDGLTSLFDFVTGLSQKREGSYEFFSHDGLLELGLTVMTTGMLEINVIAGRHSLFADEIRFGFEGKEY